MANLQGHEMSDLLPNLQEVLRFCLSNKKNEDGTPSGTEELETFNTLLKDNGALLAGGAIVTSFLDYNVNDLDIYVPIKNLRAFIEGIVKLIKPYDVLVTESSFYCRSFLRRNGIRSIYKFVYNLDGSTNPLKGVSHNPCTIEIMAVRNKRSPLEVVNNFDLTFCQVWYDGEKIRGSHPDHLINKHGLLQGDYVKMYLSGNLFLRKRVHKYQTAPRGFKIDLDPVGIDSIDVQSLIKNGNIVEKIEHDEAYLHKWATRNLMRFILTNRWKPLNSSFLNCIDKLRASKGYRLITDKTPYKHLPDDGYDSEEYDEESLEKLKQLPNLKYTTITDQETNFAHSKHDLYYLMNYNLIVKNYPILHSVHEVVLGEELVRFVIYYKKLVTRIGRCIITYDDDEVWDLHEHSLDEGISVEGMKGYLDSHIRDIDKTTVPCFINKCPYKLQEHEMRAFVNDEYWEIFKLPGNIDSKISTDIFETIVKDEKTWGTGTRMLGLNTPTPQQKTVRDGWGSLYHHVLCPYCLQQEYRRGGCAYIVHDSMGVSDTNKSPWCQKHLVVKELYDKYYSAWKRLHPTGYLLEFCVTCGRPSCGHKHFDLNDPPNIIEYQRSATDDPMEGAYTKCMGGGRPEMIARLLAIKKVIKEQEFGTDIEQRKACALAADLAPRNEELMAKARLIFNRERRKRGTYETFNTNDSSAIEENDVEQTIEQLENVVNLEPDQIANYERQLLAGPNPAPPNPAPPNPAPPNP